jgi:hypothetical protein
MTIEIRYVSRKSNTVRQFSGADAEAELARLSANQGEPVGPGYRWHEIQGFGALYVEQIA